MRLSSLQTRTLITHARRLTLAALLLQTMAFAGSVPSAAASSSCADPTPYELMPRTGSEAAAPAAPVDSAMLNELAQAKQAAGVLDPSAVADIQRAQKMSPSLADKLQRMSAAAGRRSATPMAIDQACGGLGVQRGLLLQQFQDRVVTNALAIDSNTKCTDNGQLCGWLNYINHQGQICTSICQSDPNHVNYFCGPATIAEATTTEGIGVSQATAASYMGTKPPPTGTTVSGITSGMQHFVGQPLKNWSWYEWVAEPWNPPYDLAQFKDYVQFDIYSEALPVVGDAVEVYGFYPNGKPYPHLTGHQITRADSPVYHIFFIGGFDWGDSTIYYTDSATSVWSTVPAFSWFDASTMLVILGGRGFLW